MNEYVVSPIPFDEHYVCWQMPDNGCNKEHKFVTYSKKDAHQWLASYPRRSYDTHSYNKYNKRPCNEMCLTNEGKGGLD